MAPGLRRDSLIGGIQYYDTVVDDARHTMTVARTAAHFLRIDQSMAEPHQLPAPGADRLLRTRNKSRHQKRGPVVGQDFAEGIVTPHGNHARRLGSEVFNARIEGQRFHIVEFCRARFEPLADLRRHKWSVYDQSRKKLWRRRWGSYWPDGPESEDYLLIRFQPERMEFMSEAAEIAPDPLTQPAVLTLSGSGWVLFGSSSNVESR